MEPVIAGLLLALMIAGRVNPNFRDDKKTEYLITITSPAGCIIVDTLLVNINYPFASFAPNIFVPKAWTPNSDGHNDFLFPLMVNMRSLNYFRIFNRWGQLVFETNISGKGWDGTFRGNQQQADMYSCTVETVTINGDIYKNSGTAVLIR